VWRVKQGYLRALSSEEPIRALGGLGLGLDEIRVVELGELRRRNGNDLSVHVSNRMSSYTFAGTNASRRELRGRHGHHLMGTG